MTDYKTISVYDSLVDDYVDITDKEPEDTILLDFIAQLKPDDYVLDLGCGPAQSSALMRERGLRVDPVDASAEMVEVANARYDIGARQALFEQINTSNTYEGVWANYSLLHAAPEDFADILQALHRALKPGGIFHLCMKVGSGSMRDKFGRFYSYYTQEELCTYLEDAGFVVGAIELGETQGLAGSMEPWIAISSSPA